MRNSECGIRKEKKITDNRGQKTEALDLGLYAHSA